MLWRYAILWSDFGKAANSEELASTAHRQALERADQALQRAPNSAWAHLSKAVAAGRAALLVGSNKKSIQLSRTVKEHADRAIVRTVYGGLPKASFEQSVADLQRAIALEARVHNHLELGRTYLKMGKTDAAREQLQIALDVLPADPFAFQDKLKARRLLENL